MPVTNCVQMSPAMTHDPVAEHLTQLRLKNHSPTSIAQRHYALGRLARYLGCEHNLDLLATTQDDLDGWQRSCLVHSPRYRSTFAAHVRQFFRWAQRFGLIREDPSVVLVAVRIPRGLPHPISEDDLTMAVSCAPDRIRPWLVLAAYAGLRAAEIAGLLREQVRDTSSPRVLDFIGKGGHARVVPMSDLVLMELQAAGLPGRGFVFTRRDGRPGQNPAARVSTLCNLYLHDLGITESLHGLRHRFGSELYRVTTDLRLVQECMGHTNPATTSGYVAWSQQAAVDAVEMIARPLTRDTVRV